MTQREAYEKIEANLAKINELIETNRELAEAYELEFSLAFPRGLVDKVTELNRWESSTGWYSSY